jgi:hypothetical protein
VAIRTLIPIVLTTATTMLVTTFCSPVIINNRFSSIAVAITGGLLARDISDRILRNSIESRLSGPDCSFEAAHQAQQLLEFQKDRKESALKKAIPLSLLTLAIGQVSVWVHPRQGWKLYAPSTLTLGIDAVYQSFYHTLDDIQDEVSPLGSVKFRDLLSLSVATGIAISILLRINKVYHVKALSTLFGTVLAETNDTDHWKYFALGGLALTLVLITFSTNAVGPPTQVIAKLVAGFCLTSLLYEKITAPDNPLHSPLWLIKLSEAGFLHYAQLWLLNLAGLYPSGWLPREIVSYFAYFWFKIHHFEMSLKMVKAWSSRQISSFGNKVKAVDASTSSTISSEHHVRSISNSELKSE